VVRPATARPGVDHDRFAHREPPDPAHARSAGVRLRGRREPPLAGVDPGPRRRAVLLPERRGKRACAGGRRRTLPRGGDHRARKHPPRTGSLRPAADRDPRGLAAAGLGAADDLTPAGADAHGKSDERDPHRRPARHPGSGRPAGRVESAAAGERYGLNLPVVGVALHLVGGVRRRACPVLRHRARARRGARRRGAARHRRRPGTCRAPPQDADGRGPARGDVVGVPGSVRRARSGAGDRPAARATDPGARGARLGRSGLRARRFVLAEPPARGRGAAIGGARSDALSGRGQPLPAAPVQLEHALRLDEPELPQSVEQLDEPTRPRRRGEAAGRRARRSARSGDGPARGAESGAVGSDGRQLPLGRLRALPPAAESAAARARSAAAGAAGRRRHDRGRLGTTSCGRARSGASRAAGFLPTSGCTSAPS